MEEFIYVRNHTARLIHLACGAVTLIPGDNKLDKRQAAIMSNCNIEPLLVGNRPWITVSEKPFEAPEEESVMKATNAALDNFIKETGNPNIADFSDGELPPEDEDEKELVIDDKEITNLDETEPGQDMGSRIAAALAAKNNS